MDALSLRVDHGGIYQCSPILWTFSGQFTSSQTAITLIKSIILLFVELVWINLNLLELKKELHICATHIIYFNEKLHNISPFSDSRPRIDYQPPTHPTTPPVGRRSWTKPPLFSNIPNGHPPGRPNLGITYSTQWTTRTRHKIPLLIPLLWSRANEN